LVSIANGEPERAYIVVRGDAVIRAQPDEAILWLTLSALGQSPGAALADVEERSQGLVRLLDELRLSSADRSTSGVTVREEFDHTARGQRSLGHRASVRTMVRITDPAIAGRLISRATTDLQVSVEGPRWSISSANPIRLQAAREAAADAARKAQAYAAGVDAKLGRLVRLQEPGTGPPSPTFRRAGGLAGFAAAGGPDQMPIEVGDQEVAAAIEATFVLEVL
jgi:uncharacterized protein YggE